jgi:hypothetical protein
VRVSLGDAERRTQFAKHALDGRPFVGRGLGLFETLADVRFDLSHRIRGDLARQE